MSLLQKAIETYDSHQALVGVAKEGHATLAPVSHIITNAQICIKLDADGELIDAYSMDEKIVIPVTETSAGRTSAPCAHPLADQIEYLNPANGEKYALYISQLKEWYESEYSHPELYPILAYVQKGTIIRDLAQKNLIDLDEKGNPLKEKTMICWSVLDNESASVTECWRDHSLFEAFDRYYAHMKMNGQKALCMVSGAVVPVAAQHPKGISAFNGNAKLISANDSSGFTYRGRFSDDCQAATVGYDASQKAHNALRWLITEQSITVGGRTFLCWNPQGLKIPGVLGGFRKQSTPKLVPTDYRDELYLTLQGYKADLPEKAGVVIAAFDAATSGRLSLTYYNELLGSDFLQRLHDWEHTCCWYNGPYGIQSPSLRRIVECAFGVHRTEKNQEKFVADDGVLKQQMQRMIACRVDSGRVQTDLVKALVNRASSPNGCDEKLWRGAVFTACAVLNKYYHDQKGVDVMAWQLDYPDRSFQFGRLLAAMERVELDYYRKTNEDRQTSAIKSMPEFRRRPFSTYERVNRHLQQAYLPRIARYPRERYARIRDEIMAIIRELPECELNKPLSDLYLMGYDLQHAEFFKSAKNDEINNDITEEDV